MSSASGGSGIYSLAPARMALTAAAALVSVPQATTGMWMRSASSAAMSPGMSTITSTSSRSAPRPERRLDKAMSMLAAWATLAPPCIASLVASESCPSRAPMIKSLMTVSLSCFDDFGHGDAKAVLDEDDFAAGDEPFVDEDFDRFADLAVEFDDGADVHLQEIGDR